MAYDRIQRVMWTDILMAQMHEGDFVYEEAVIQGPTDGTTYEIEPGEALYLVSRDTDGVKTVAPVDVTKTANITALAGFATQRKTINASETDRLVIAVTGCKLCIDNMPETDQFGNSISYDFTTGSLREAAEAKLFKFGKKN